MVKVIFDKKFQKIDNPVIGKPMMYARKDIRELYVSSFRLSYKYDQSKDIIEFLDIYHKDEQ